MCLWTTLSSCWHQFPNLDLSSWREFEENPLDRVTFSDSIGESCWLSKEREVRLGMDDTEGLASAVGQAAGYVASALQRYVLPNVSSRGMAFDKSDEYDMNHAMRGEAVIINNDKFQVNLPDRKGSELDVENLEMALKKLDFRVTVQENLKVSEMQAYFQNLAKFYPRDADCFVCVILSHGDEVYMTPANPEESVVREDIVYGVDKWMPTRGIVEMFSDDNCPALCGKPRIFFIQACRGKKLDGGQVILVKKRKEEDMDVVDAAGAPEEVVCPPPLFKDFLLMYSTPPGFFSFRRPDMGSWFISSLCEILTTNDPSKTDLLRLLTKVCRKVGHDLQSCSFNYALHEKKQSPCIYSMLTKDVYFRPKKP